MWQKKPIAAGSVDSPRTFSPICRVFYTHEHDFVLTNKRGEKDKHVLGCQMCNILYCERCGKEVSLCTISIEAKGEEFKRL